MAKAAEELRVRDAAMLYYNQQQQQQQQLHHLQLEGHGQVLGPPQAAQLGFGPAGVAAVLRSSKYVRAAQELLEEFCSIGRGQFRSARIGRGSAANNPNPKSGGNSGASSSAVAAAAASTSSSKEAPPLSPAERFEHQRKKAKLISMLDEVERRYNHYCEQMQMVVNSFDSVMGFGAATPYTALAQKAMSRHFRCLKDAISAQLRQACELLGEKDAGGGSGLTKGETPRLRILDQNLRQQRAFHHMGMMEQEAWRPQRGLPSAPSTSCALGSSSTSSTRIQVMQISISWQGRPAYPEIRCPIGSSMQESGYGSPWWRRCTSKKPRTMTTTTKTTKPPPMQRRRFRPPPPPE
uniref:POX domain-containing protein n=1 Tax=Ananas comosus var. bracteatus TaxID=296719 RepID=A0A6V7QXQ9_ANACO